MSLGYRKLGRNSSQRKALLRDLITDLIINEKIETTLYKAKELQRLADKMITLGKKGENDLAAIRQAAKMIRFEKVDEETYAIQKLFKELAPKYKDRNGGYTRVLKTMPRRGDNAPMAIISFVE
ncbi:MAG: 50S ribosomal protein L17 [Coprobacillus sp.]|nr:50S ribosomal protein L17 [Coprobacillus sp.]MDY4145949.1 50S ribosomal protein L17 [Bacilli bacterium]OLA10963.1 MAG: 50S ribosomal protein L17 [Coprobacillus sp. 28_7]CCY08451.1 50S ribosomal protein L17 [Coprobacillus sp. CAG:698]